MSLGQSKLAKERDKVEVYVVENWWKCVDENGSLGRKKRIKEKEKWKRNYNEKIFFLERNIKIMKVADSRD